MADRDRRLEFLSGFTGEYGTIIITKEHSYLWTDYENKDKTSNVDENWTVLLEGCMFSSVSMAALDLKNIFFSWCLVPQE